MGSWEARDEASEAHRAPKAGRARVGGALAATAAVGGQIRRDVVVLTLADMPVDAFGPLISPRRRLKETRETSLRVS